MIAATLIFLVAAAIAVPVLLYATRRGRATLDEHPWPLPETAKLHISIMGGLAGFAVTGIVLLVSLARDRSDVVTADFDTVVIMFVVAYFYYIGNAFLISYLPRAEATHDILPRLHFSLASTIEYRTLFVSWFALRPLFEAYGLVGPAAVLGVLLPLSLLIGSVIIAMAADGLGLIHLKETYVSVLLAALLAFSGAAIVALVAPAANTSASTLALTLVIFCINGAGYALAALTPVASRYPGIERFYQRHGRRLVIVDMQLTMISLTLLWLAVIGLV